MAKKSVSASEFLIELDGPLSLGGLLEAIRLCEDWSRDKMAKKLGITKYLLNQIESKKKLASPEQAMRFAKKIGYSDIMFVKYSLEDQLRKAKLPYRVKIEKAKSIRGKKF